MLRNRFPTSIHWVILFLYGQLILLILNTANSANVHGNTKLIIGMIVGIAISVLYFAVWRASNLARYMLAGMGIITLLLKLSGKGGYETDFYEYRAYIDIVFFAHFISQLFYGKANEWFRPLYDKETAHTITSNSRIVMQKKLMSELVSACFGDREKALRLIEYERRIHPHIRTLEAIDNALDRLCHDRGGAIRNAA